ncbi:transferrin-binding protein [Mobiluncus mulieris]|nr:transferrin-binding protein [Mobiluncus mulieris]
MNNERSAPQQQHWGATGSIQYTKDTAAGLPVSGALIGAGIKTGLTRVECEHTLHSAGNTALGGVE